MNPHFENVRGYSLVKLGDEENRVGDRVAQYFFTLDPETPLTYHDGKSGKIQPDRVYKSDMGTVPWFLQRLVPKDKYLLAFLFHDTAWEHEGIWYCGPGYETFSFVKMGRAKSNRLLRDMVLVEGEMNEVDPRELKRDVRWIKVGVDLYALWARITRRKPLHKRSS